MKRQLVLSLFHLYHLAAKLNLLHFLHLSNPHSLCLVIPLYLIPGLLLLDFQIKFNWKRSLFYYWYFVFSIISIKLSILAKDSIEIFFYLLFIYFEFQQKNNFFCQRPGYSLEIETPIFQ